MAKSINFCFFSTVPIVNMVKMDIDLIFHRIVGCYKPDLHCPIHAKIKMQVLSSRSRSLSVYTICTTQLVNMFLL